MRSTFLATDQATVNVTWSPITADGRSFVFESVAYSSETVEFFTEGSVDVVTGTSDVPLFHVVCVPPVRIPVCDATAFCEDCPSVTIDQESNTEPEAARSLWLRAVVRYVMVTSAFVGTVTFSKSRVVFPADGASGVTVTVPDGREIMESNFLLPGITSRRWTFFTGQSEFPLMTSVEVTEFDTSADAVSFFVTSYGMKVVEVETNGKPEISVDAVTLSGNVRFVASETEFA